MTLLSLSPANATATIAVYKTLTQAGKERGMILGHPTVADLIARTEAMAEMQRTLNAVDSRITQVDIDNLVGAATAEGMLPVASTLTVTNQDAHPSRFALLLQPTDQETAQSPFYRLLSHVARMSNEPDVTDLKSVASLAAIMTRAWGNTFVANLKALVSSFGNTSGTAATDYSYTAFRAAIKARRLIASGKGLCLLQGAHGWDPVENDILTAGGAIAQSLLGQRVLNEGGENLLYSDVYMATDVLVTSGLPTVVADQYGGCFYPGALALRAHASKPIDGSGRRVVLSTPLFDVFELGYAGGSVDSYEMVWYEGLSVLNANLAFRILHD